MKTEQNKPAFPVSEETTDRIDEGVNIYTGLTKREYFAAMAMQGVLAKHGLPEGWANETILNQLSSAAIASVAAADALIKALNENQ